jgi:hypothetical protein
MSMKTTLVPLALAAGLFVQVRASLIVDNLNATTVVTTGSQATFRWQSFTPSVAGVGPTDTIAANSPLTADVALTSAEFLRAPSGTASTGLIFIDVHEYDAATDTLGAYIGSSADSLDVNNTAFNAPLTWTFPSLVLNPATPYALAFSSDGAPGNVYGSGAGARISAANFGSGFVSTYTGGEAVGSVGAVAFDARFRVGMQVVPEPSAFSLFALGGLLAARLSRRRVSPESA